MAGPGIRYHQIATELSKNFDTTLGVFSPKYIVGLEETTYTAIDIKSYNFQSDFIKFDAIFALWLSNEMIDFAKKHNIVLIFDLYAPVPIEDYVGRKYANKILQQDDLEYKSLLQNYRHFLSVGDYFVCSNPIQIDMWTGFAFSSGSITPGTTKDFDISERIGLLPMGINLKEIEKTTLKDPLKKQYPQINKDDLLLVWTGGIWDWFDGLSPIKAMDRLVKNGTTNVKLVFLGTKHPNPDVPEMGETAKTISLSDQLKLTNKYVFFREGWIDYDKRLSYLQEADIALYAHRSSLEARYSHRTRVLDHILVGLPTIATKGDYLTDLIQDNKYGESVKPENVMELSDLLLGFAKDKNSLKKYRDNIERDKDEFTWENSVSSLVDFLDRGDITPRKPKSGTIYTPPKLKLTLKRYTPKKVKNVIRKFM